MGLLTDVLSRVDAMKRRAGGLLSDPAATLAQWSAPDPTDPNMAAVGSVMPGVAPPLVQNSGAIAGGLLGTIGGMKPTIPWREGGGSQTVKIGNSTLDYGIASDGSSAEVIMLHTPPELRGKGSARQAMETFLDEAQRQGTPVRLHAQPMPNYMAQRPDAGDTAAGALGLRDLRKFYSSLGFKPAGGDLMVWKPER